MLDSYCIPTTIDGIQSLSNRKRWNLLAVQIIFFSQKLVFLYHLEKLDRIFGCTANFLGASRSGVWVFYHVAIVMANLSTLNLTVFVFGGGIGREKAGRREHSIENK